MRGALRGASPPRRRQRRAGAIGSARGSVSDNICYRDAYVRETQARSRRSIPMTDAVLPGPHRLLSRRRRPAGRPRLAAWRRWRRLGVTGARSTATTSGTRWRASRRPAGAPVTAELDWDRRHALMRTHSALHVLCGVIWRDHQASVTGGNMEPLSGRMDFEFETMHGDLVADIERRVNEEIAADREIRVAVLPRDEAFAIPDLIRTKINLLPEGISEVRTIEIVGLDLQADGGTHVARTSRDRPRAGDRLRVEGPHQQADPDRGHLTRTPFPRGSRPNASAASTPANSVERPSHRTFVVYAKDRGAGDSWPRARPRGPRTGQGRSRLGARSRTSRRSGWRSRRLPVR